MESIRFPSSISEEKIKQFTELYENQSYSMAEAFFWVFMTHYKSRDEYYVNQEELYVFVANLPHTFTRSWEPIFYFPDNSSIQFNSSDEPFINH